MFMSCSVASSGFFCYAYKKVPQKETIQYQIIKATNVPDNA